MPIAIFFLFAYFIAFHVSIAGMEILIWTVILPGFYHAYKDKTILWPQKLVSIAFIGLLVSATISFFINIGDMSQFIDYIGEFRWIITFIGVMQFFRYYHPFINYRNLVSAGQIVLLIAGFYSFYQFFTAHDPFRPHVVFHYIYDGSPYFRPNSFFGLPTTYAYASAMFFAVSLSFFLREDAKMRPWQRLVERAYLVISPINIFIAFTRAVWISFVINTLTILKIHSTKYFIRVSVILALLFLAFYTSFTSFQNRINSVFDNNYVANHNRIYLWKANLMIFADHPFFGYGFENDPERKLIDSYLNKLDKPEIMRNHSHNTYINFLSSLGIFGAGFFYLFIFAAIRTNILGIRYSQNHLHKTLFIGILGMQMVLLLGGFTECTFEDSELNHQYLFYIALQEFLYLSYIRPQMDKANLINS